MNHHARVRLLGHCIFKSVFQAAKSCDDIGDLLLLSYYLYYETLQFCSLNQ